MRQITPVIVDDKARVKKREKDRSKLNKLNNQIMSASTDDFVCGRNLSFALDIVSIKACKKRTN